MQKFSAKDLEVTRRDNDQALTLEDVADYEKLPKLSLSRFSITRDQLELLAKRENTGLDGRIMRVIDVIRKQHKYGVIFPYGGASAIKMMSAFIELIRKCKQERVAMSGVCVGSSGGAIASVVRFVAGFCEKSVEKAEDLAELFHGIEGWRLLAGAVSEKPEGSPFRSEGGAFTLDKMIALFTQRLLEMFILRKQSEIPKERETMDLLVLVTYDATDKQHRYFLFTDPESIEDIKPMVLAMAGSCALPRLGIATNLRIVDKDTGKVHDFKDVGYDALDITHAIVGESGKVLAFPGWGYGSIIHGPWRRYGEDSNVLEVDLAGEKVSMSGFTSFVVFSRKAARMGAKVVADHFKAIKEFLGSEQGVV